MSFVTQTITATTTDSGPSTSISDVTVTVTSHLYTTLSATQGQTVTVSSPSPLLPPSPTTKYTPLVATTTETSTVTVTELDVFLQNAQGSVYSTWVFYLSAPEGSAASAVPPSPSPSVAEPHNDGWNTWSKGAKVGMIVGVVLGALLLIGMLLCCCRKRNIWFVHGWPWAAPVAPALNPGPSVVQPTFVNGPLTPYSHVQPTYDYGHAQCLRGGGKSGRYFSASYREWFGRKRKEASK